jgi:hypothetical protein
MEVKMIRLEQLPRMGEDYNRAVSAVNGLELLKSNGLMDVRKLGAIIGAKNAYKTLSGMYRAAASYITWTDHNDVPGLMSKCSNDRLLRTWIKNPWGGWGRM